MWTPLSETHMVCRWQAMYITIIYTMIHWWKGSPLCRKLFIVSESLGTYSSFPFVIGFSYFARSKWVMNVLGMPSLLSPSFFEQGGFYNYKIYKKMRIIQKSTIEDIHTHTHSLNTMKNSLRPFYDDVFGHACSTSSHIGRDNFFIINSCIFM